jgi:hypothetical protein
LLARNVHWQFVVPQQYGEDRKGESSGLRLLSLQWIGDCWRRVHEE